MPCVLKSIDNNKAKCSLSFILKLYQYYNVWIVKGPNLQFRKLQSNEGLTVKLVSQNVAILVDFQTYQLSGYNAIIFTISLS